MGEDGIKKLASVMLIRHLFSDGRSTREWIIVVSATEHKELWDHEENRRGLSWKKTEEGSLSHSDELLKLPFLRRSHN